MLAKYISWAFAGAAFVTGILAAIYWYLSARVEIPNPGINLPEGDFQDPDVLQQYLNHIYWVLLGMRDSGKNAASLNKKAAAWTAASVAFGSLSALFGSYSST